jgi:hypothetical protein
MNSRPIGSNPVFELRRLPWSADANEKTAVDEGKRCDSDNVVEKTMSYSNPAELQERLRALSG